MHLSCNHSGSEYDCSFHFEGVDVSVTSLQACFAAVILLISVPTNLLLIVAMIVYHHLLDKASVLAISLLVANTLVSVLMNGQVFITTISRAWLFGYWGCHLIASVTIFGLFSRWITVGLLSVDRFCRVFFPFSYTRSENKALAVQLIVSWLPAVFPPIVMYLGKSTGFDLSYPGCSFAVVFPKLSQVNRAVVGVLLLSVTTVGTVLPSILYTAMYLKGKSLRRAHPVISVTLRTDPNTTESLLRSKRATFTYSLMVVTFFAVSVLLIVKLVVKASITGENSTVSPTMGIALLFFISTLTQCYVIADLVIILSNKDERKALYRLLLEIIRFMWYKN